MKVNFFKSKAFLSERYGARSIPNIIKIREYNILKNEIEYFKEFDTHFEYLNNENGFSLVIENMFDFCYEFDDNEIPSSFRLKNIDKIIPDYNENVKLYKF